MSNDEFGTSGNAYNTSISLGDAGSAQPATTGGIKDISTQEFVAEVIEPSQQIPVLVDFWAPWCGPCKQLAPALEKAVAETRGRIKLVKMDIDKHPEIPGQMGIQSIPAVVAFVNGRPGDMFMGVKSEGEIKEFIAKLIGPSDEDDQIEQLLEHAAQLVEQGAIGDAGSIYGQILTIDPNNLKAIAAVGHLYLSENNMDGAKGVLSNLSEDDLKDSDIVSLVSAIDLAEQADGLADHTELQATIEKNPDDHQTRFDLAIAMNASGNREEAADHLLDIMKRMPGWNDDAARTQLLQFFEAWGLTDETTVSSRRKLSALLFS